MAALPAGAVVVTGGARGLDAVAELQAARAGLEVEVFEADWDRYGRSAGLRRNEAMLRLPDVLGVFAFRRRGKSKGTDHTVRLAKTMGVRGRVLKER
jgi:protoporphyrinogen oxidase